MQLPSRLSDTTLGDLLGTLFRSQATGSVELIEAGWHAGRRHVIELREGRIVSVHSDALGPRLGALLELEADQPPEGTRVGESLVARGLITEEQLRGALSLQMRQRLEHLFSLAEAEIRFRAPRPRRPDRTAPRPLGKEEFLHGRPRARQRTSTKSAAGGPSGGGRSPERGLDPVGDRRRLDALQVLGLSATAHPGQVRAAFRQLARQLHPDAHPHASPLERARLLRRFGELSRAYHLLTG